MAVKLAAPYRPPIPKSKFLLSTFCVWGDVLGRMSFEVSGALLLSSLRVLHETLKRCDEVLENRGEREKVFVFLLVFVVGRVDKVKEAMMFNWCLR